MNKIDRRTVLRGAAGVALGLPWLEAMGSSILNGNTRLAFLFMPNGVNESQWDPKGKGSNYSLPYSLEPLNALKDDFNLHSNLYHPGAQTGDGHYSKTANFLSGKHVKKSTSDLFCGVSADQVAAKYIGQNSYLPSIELGVKKTNIFVDTNVGFTTAYGGHISWTSETVPAPKEIIPSQAFQRLFKGAKQKTSTAEETKSILDYIKEDTIRMKKYLGREDSYRIEQYFSSVRSLERRIQRAAKDSYQLPRDAVNPKKGIPENYGEHVDLMLDIMVLAFQTNRTKIATFMFGNSVSPQKFDFLNGVEGGHHELSHTAGDKKKEHMIGTITRYHIERYARFLAKMKAVKEGNKTLLDNSLVLMGSGLKNANAHRAINLPLIVAGKGGGKVKTGEHKVHRPKSKMNNLLLGMMQTAGCPLKTFNDSDGSII
ncbi:MAG: DUF1552 domain-containing protein [Lentisphaeraceae bacterium]|nr:DUF1552 domain-containing protein [Lentisphaeraceae bacterium]